MPQLVSQWLLLQIALIISAALHAKTKMFGKQHVLMMVQLAPHHGLDAFCNHWGRCFSVQLDKEQAIRHPLAVPSRMQQTVQGSLTTVAE